MKKKLTKDEKICFAFEFLNVEKDYKKLSKRVKIFSILETLALVVSAVFIPLNAFAAAFYGSVVSSLFLVPTLAAFSLKRADLINDLGTGAVSYKQFKKLKKSKEWEHYLNYARNTNKAVSNYRTLSKEEIESLNNDLNKNLQKVNKKSKFQNQNTKSKIQQKEESKEK